MAEHREADKNTEPATAMSRRTFIGGVALTAAATTGLSSLVNIASSEAASAAAGVSEGLRFLTVRQAGLLTEVLNRVIPPEDGLPGAGDVGVTGYIDGVLAEAAHLRPHIVGLLADVDARSAASGLPGAELDQRLRLLQQEQKESFDVLLQAAYTGYYSHPDVLAAVGWIPAKSPTDTGTFDVTRLDDVRRRGPIYRHV